ncbi:Hsp20/alpha crystallin family protein [uncultured Limimaricola sp.]|uniref:Hsp20/alpha crystallin family protein n=1 Tax=uncultured Limimaricola sp. TaxID=2211667 RepID=UPI0030FB3025
MATKNQKVEVSKEAAKQAMKPQSMVQKKPSDSWEPFASLRGEMDRLFDEFSPAFWRMPLARQAFGPIRETGGHWQVSPAVDFLEREDAFEMQAELPGLTAEDVEVKLSDGKVTIRGQKSASRDERSDEYHLSERSYGAFMRSFGLPKGIDEDKVEARFANGVLTVRLPKSQDALRHEKRVSIKTS